MKSPRSAWFLWLLIPLPAAGGLVFVLYPKLLTGDFAEITIESITSTALGEIEIRYRGRLSVGTRLEVEGQRGGSEYILPVMTATDRFPGRPASIGGAGGPRVHVIYSIHNEQGGLANPDELRGRLILEEGRTYKIRPGGRLWVYRYTASDGFETLRYFSVYPATR